MIELEGLWVKLGQYLSTRADVLPQAYISLLRQLQDSLPPRPLQEVKVFCNSCFPYLFIWRINRMKSSGLHIHLQFLFALLMLMSFLIFLLCVPLVLFVSLCCSYYLFLT